MTTEQNDSNSWLMKIVETIVISPENAREVVAQYTSQARKFAPSMTDEKISDAVVNKIISRYSKLATKIGATTALPGVIPGIGTAVSTWGGGIMDISVCIKLQIDMTLCIGLAINGKISNEDAKHMSYIIALYSSLEHRGSSYAVKMGTKASKRMVLQYLKGPTLQIIKDLFKKIGISFTQKTTAKVIPFGVGVIISGMSNYALTTYVGRIAHDIFLLNLKEEDAME